MTALFLDDNAVRATLTFPTAVDALEDMFRELGAGLPMETTRTQLVHPNGWMRVLTASLPHRGVFGYKEFHLTRSPKDDGRAVVRYAIHLFDAASGAAIATVDAHHLTAVRTAATAAVALKFFAPHDDFSLGVIGSGGEARAQVEAFAAVSKVKDIRIFSPRPERREHLAAHLSEALSVPAHASDSPEAAVSECSVLIAATNTAGSGPAVMGDWLHSGMHVSSIGSTTPRQREIDSIVFDRADVVVVDTLDVLEESGDALDAQAAGVLDPARVVPLAMVVAGKADARRGSDDITLYKSIGSGLQDICLAYEVTQCAKQSNLGRSVRDEFHAKDVAAN